VADLEQKVEFLSKVVKNVEESHHILARTILTANQRVDLVETERKKLATQLEILSRDTPNKGKLSN
jgi:hypothetical protein